MSNRSQQQQFLEDLATEYKLYGDMRTAFLGRFAPENADKANKDLKLTWQKDPENEVQKIQDELKKIYRVLRENGCDIPETQRGRYPKGESPWELAYKWLWEVKFPEWQKKHQHRLGGKPCQSASLQIFTNNRPDHSPHLAAYQVQYGWA